MHLTSQKWVQKEELQKQNKNKPADSLLLYVKLLAVFSI